MENQNDQMTICPKCKAAVRPEFYFCPQCGKNLRSKSASISAGNQIKAYAISLFLPPFGLYYSYKYFKSGTDKARIIAWVTVILTVLSLYLSWLFFENIFAIYQQYLNQFQSLGI